VEIHPPQGVDFIERRAAVNGCDVLFVGLKVNFVSVQLARYAKEFFYRHGGGAGFLYLGLHGTGNRNVQIRCGKLDASFSARSSTLERIGSVVRVLTTFWTACSRRELLLGDGQVMCV